MRSITALYSLLIREVENDSIQVIEQDTYTEIAKVLGSMKGQGYDGLEARVRDALVNLLTEIASTLLCLRVEKARSPFNTYANLTYEERYIIEAEKESKLRYDLVLSAILEGRTKVLEAVVNKTKTRLVLVRVTKPVQEFIGIDNIKYGPFKEEDIASLPFENAHKLIEERAAIELTLVDY